MENISFGNLIKEYITNNVRQDRRDYYFTMSDGTQIRGMNKMVRHIEAVYNIKFGVDELYNILVQMKENE